MRYPASILDEIRARLPVSAVVGRKVRLKKAGREWKGLSPFNAEKTPSFTVNDQKGFYHCFSSGKHGDVFTFLIETEGLSFPDAVERLAAEAGVPLPKPSRDAEVQEERRRSLYDVVELACRFFEGQLQGGKGREVREYLARRQILPETQAEFRIGFAPDSRTALLDHLRGNGVEDAEVVRAGLAIAPEDGRGLYDRFRGRLIIPIQDRKGRVVAFGGRALAPDAQPKYLNSPETELFHKGEMVFNGHRAREAAHRTGSAIVVEGYLDAITVFQAGIKSVVATLGTAFTEEQIAALWRLAPEPIICFDGDNAGRSAAYRALDRILPALKTGFSFRFAFLPAGQDPDELIKAHGADAFRSVIDDAFPFWDVLWNREIGAANLGTPDGQAVLEKRFADLIGTIGDKRLKRLYELRARVYLSDLFWRHERERSGARRPKTDTAILRATELLVGIPTRQVGLERIFLGLCVEFPDLALDCHERLMALRMRGSSKGTDGEAFSHQGFANALLDLLTGETIADTHEIYRRMDPQFFGALDYLHGRETPELPMGHNLRRRFPMLQHNPGPDLMDRCFFHLLRMLELREMEDHLGELIEHLPGELDEPTEREILGFQAEILHLRERVHADENELAEEASQLRRPGGARFTGMQLAA